MRIVFMGTPDFAQKSLEAVYNNGHEIIKVITQPDKPKGRGMKMIAPPVKEFALAKGIDVEQPLKVKNNTEFINSIKELKPELLVVVAYGKILPQELLDIPTYGAINVHGSLLPKYRGAAPIQWAVLNGDKETGITTMFMDAGMDTGDMILKQRVPIRDDETTGELWDEMADVGAKLLVETIEKIGEAALSDEMAKARTATFAKSNSEQVDLDKARHEWIMSTLKELVGAEKQGEDFTLAPMLNKEMAKIEWSKSAQEIHNLVRGLNPIMGAFTYFDGKKLKIWKTEVEETIKNTEAENGEAIVADKKDGLVIKTGNGCLRILEVQPESKKKMGSKDFLNGLPIMENRAMIFE